MKLESQTKFQDIIFLIYRFPLQIDPVMEVDTSETVAESSHHSLPTPRLFTWESYIKIIFMD